MRKQQLLLWAFIACTTLSFAQEDNWDVYMAQYEKGAGSTIINMSLKEKAPFTNLPFLLQVSVRPIKCSKDGLPDEHEFEVLYNLSDTMKAVTDAATVNKAAGTFSYQCERTDYYYISDTTIIRGLLQEAFKKHYPQYSFTIKLKTDADWQAYFNFLYPNEVTFEYMQNEKVILGLQQAGDNLQKPRQVDHWLYFKTELGREQFVVFATKEKFKIENKQIIKDASLQYQLHISREDRVDPDSISSITIELRKKARQLNGDYDGWETFVVK